MYLLPVLPLTCRETASKPSLKSITENVKRSVQEPTSLKLLTLWRMKEASNLQGSSLTGTEKKINPLKRKETEGEKLPLYLEVNIFKSLEEGSSLGK